MARPSPARLRALPTLLLALLLIPMSSPASAQGSKDSVEYPVKAAFLYKFGDYVGWPATSFQAPVSPVSLCVVGQDPFGPILDSTVAGEKIDGRPITVQRLRAIDRGSNCHIAYLAGSEQQSVAQALDAVRGTAVLTITDEVRGTARGVVHFVIRANRVRFEIDDEAAKQNGLAISSKLFSIALSVKPRS